MDVVPRTVTVRIMQRIVSEVPLRKAPPLRRPSRHFGYECRGLYPKCRCAKLRPHEGRHGTSDTNAEDCIRSAVAQSSALTKAVTALRIRMQRIVSEVPL